MKSFTSFSIVLAAAGIVSAQNFICPTTDTANAAITSSKIAGGNIVCTYASGVCTYSASTGTGVAANAATCSAAPGVAFLCPKKDGANIALTLQSSSGGNILCTYINNGRCVYSALTSGAAIAAQSTDTSCPSTQASPVATSTFTCPTKDTNNVAFVPSSQVSNNDLSCNYGADGYCNFDATTGALDAGASTNTFCAATVAAPPATTTYTCPPADKKNKNLTGSTITGSNLVCSYPPGTCSYDVSSGLLTASTENNCQNTAVAPVTPPTSYSCPAKDNNGKARTSQAIGGGYVTCKYPGGSCIYRTSSGQLYVGNYAGCPQNAV